MHYQQAQDVFCGKYGGKEPLQVAEGGAVFFRNGLYRLQHNGRQATQDGHQQYNVKIPSGRGVRFKNNVMPAGAPARIIPVAVAHRSLRFSIHQPPNPSITV